MILFHEKEKRRIWPYFVLVFFILLAAAGVWTYRWAKDLTAADIIGSSFIRGYISTNAGDRGKRIFDLMPFFLGLKEPKVYLVLFLNNTELRPGGGFIGSYAILKASGGQFELIKTEGTESLDSNAPSGWRKTPPAPIAEHLGVDRWYFRDSNWSPDFSENAKKALEFYAAEGGVMADQIDLVVGITPDVVQEIMKITGPVTVQGIIFDADNVVEKLEYEVEYGYADKGVVFTERKQIMEPLARALLQKAEISLLDNIGNYKDLLSRVVEEKLVLVFASDKDLEGKLKELGLTGLVNGVHGDYLMWVDANLAALKTDLAMKRTLSYSFAKNEQGRLVARASMKYEHQGKFDWRTTRYRTYARVFVPEGSELINVDGAMKTDRSATPGTIDMGRELEKQWFGAFIAVEPGDERILTFTYLLPEFISKQIEDGLYTLFVQKQLGTIDHGLTVELNFDKTIRSASPSERREEWGDNEYILQSDLRVDRGFEVALD